MKEKLSVRNPGVFLFGLFPPGRNFPDWEPPLEELASLARAAGARILGRAVQKRAAPHPATFFGRGKALEMAERVALLGADLAICDQELTPAQGRNLERILGVRVLDRTELILDLFATRARTAQAKVQVELARLEYALPRLRRMWSHLDRERGGIGLRGAGEKQIESDRRLIRKRVQDLKRALEKFQSRAIRKVRARRGLFKICLVGYANAGKSSLMNALADCRVVVADRPFSTLDTRTRMLDLGEGRKALLSDTVGFIRNIPHHLVASFQATLAEVVHADLLLHVVDVSRPGFQEDVNVVEGVLASIGAGEVPRILLLNKVDLLEDALPLNLAARSYPEALPVSARSGKGLDTLADLLGERVLPRPVTALLHLPFDVENPGGLLRKYAAVLDEKWKDEGLYARVRTDRRGLKALLREGCRLVSGKESGGPFPPGGGGPSPRPGR